MKRNIKVYFFLVSLVIISLNMLYLFGLLSEAYSLDANLATVICNQLSEDEASLLSTKDYYDVSIDDSVIN